MKKVILVLLVLLLMSVGTVFGSEAPKVIKEWADPVRERLAGTEISILASAHPSINAFQKLTPQFEDLTGIKVNWVTISESAMYGRILMELSAGGKNINAMMVCAEYLFGLVDLDAIEPLNKYIENLPAWFDWEDIIPAYRSVLTGLDGNVYAAPFAGESGFLMYRKDLFDKYGISVPATYDEVLEVAKFFHNKDLNGDGKGDIDGIAFRGRRGWGMNWPWALVTFPFGGELLDPKTGDSRFNSQGTIDALSFLVKAAKYAPEGIESFGHYEAWTSFMTGRAAMLIESTAAAPLIEDKTSSLVVGKVGYSAMPKGPAGAYSGVWAWGLGMAKASSEKQKEAVWALMTYLFSREKQEEYLDNKGVVTRTSGFVYLEKEKLPYLSATKDALAQAEKLAEKGYTTVPRTPIWMEVVELMGTYGSMAVAGQMTPEVAAEVTQEMVQKAIDRNRESKRFQKQK